MERKRGGAARPCADPPPRWGTLVGGRGESVKTKKKSASSSQPPPSLSSDRRDAWPPRGTQHTPARHHHDVPLQAARARHHQAPPVRPRRGAGGRQHLRVLHHVPRAQRECVCGGWKGGGGGGRGREDARVAGGRANGGLRLPRFVPHRPPRTPAPASRLVSGWSHGCGDPARRPGGVLRLPLFFFALSPPPPVLAHPSAPFPPRSPPGPYEGGVWKLHVELPEVRRGGGGRGRERPAPPSLDRTNDTPLPVCQRDAPPFSSPSPSLQAYPYKSPSIGFVNRIYHPNVDEL